MRERILNDLKEAMRSQKKEELMVIRMVKGAIQMEELNVKHELSDDEVISIIGKQIKTRKESIAEFQKGNRNDLIEKTQSEIEILEKYMPEQLSTEEIDALIDKVFDEVNPTGMSDMGCIMGKLTPLCRGKADMSQVSMLVKNKLNEK